MSESIRTIKKYPNRRLYDTTTSIYITLADVKKLVLDHTEFRVEDAKSKNGQIFANAQPCASGCERLTDAFTACAAHR